MCLRVGFAAALRSKGFSTALTVGPDAGVLANDIDIDIDRAVLSATLATGPTNGTVTVAPQRQLRVHTGRRLLRRRLLHLHRCPRVHHRAEARLDPQPTPAVATPATLPRTGADSKQLAKLESALVLLGAALQGGARPSRRRKTRLGTAN